MRPHTATMLAICAVVALLAGVIIYDRATAPRLAPPEEVVFSHDGLETTLLNELGASMGCDLDVRPGDTLVEGMRRLRVCRERHVPLLHQ